MILFWSSWIRCKYSSITSLSLCKTALCGPLILYSFYIPYTFISLHLPSLLRSLTFQLAYCKLDTTSVREICACHAGCLVNYAWLPPLAFLLHYQLQPWRVFHLYPVILRRILECLSLLPIGSSWFGLSTLCIWCVSGAVYIHALCVCICQLKEMVRSPFCTYGEIVLGFFGTYEMCLISKYLTQKITF